MDGIFQKLYLEKHRYVLRLAPLFLFFARVWWFWGSTGRTGIDHLGVPGSVWSYACIRREVSVRSVVSPVEIKLLYATCVSGFLSHLNCSFIVTKNQRGIFAQAYFWAPSSVALIYVSILGPLCRRMHNLHTGKNDPSLFCLEKLL